MRNLQITSVALPSALDRELKREQKASGMTRSELFRTALRRYLTQEARWRKLQAYGIRQARKAGLRSDEKIMNAALAAQREVRRR